MRFCVCWTIVRRQALKVASLGLYRLLASKASTRQAYAQDLADFARFLGADSSQAAALQLLAGGPGLANQLVHDYLVQLRQRGLASATINRRLSALRSLVRLARLFHLISWTLELPGEKARSAAALCRRGRS
jgi:integrase/recombinase XerC